MRGTRFGAYLAFGCASLLALHAAGEVPDAALERQLARLGAVAETLDRTLPSFTCKETGTSEVRTGKKLRERVSFVATLRARRLDAGAHNETYSLTELNGQPYTGRYSFPFYVSGGFDNGMRYFVTSMQPCYRYALQPGRIDFATAPDVSQRPGCRDEGMKGFALLDSEGNVTHLERRVSAAAVDVYGLAPFSAIDFAPVDLNGETFRLSQHMIAEHSYSRISNRFEVTYSDCRLFHVTVTLDDTVPEPKP